MNLLEQLTVANKKENIDIELKTRYIGLRQCSICGKYKEKDNFVVKNKLKGWLDTRCNECKRIKVKKLMQNARKKLTQ